MGDQCSWIVEGPRIKDRGKTRVWWRRRCKRKASQHGYCTQHYRMLPACSWERIERDKQ